MTTYPADYLRDAIADEVTLANLLGYRNLEIPLAPESRSVLWGVAADFKAEWPGQLGRSMLPKWRRGNDCFELIAICNLCIVTCDARVSVGAGAGKAFTGHAEVSQHPSKDDAIRFAMCKAAIAYLQAESSTTKESK